MVLRTAMRLVAATFANFFMAFVEDDIEMDSDERKFCCC